MTESKNKSKIEHLRKNYVRFPLDLKPEVLERFRAVCAARGTTPTTEIKKFISRYCEEECAARRAAYPIIITKSGKDYIVFVPDFSINTQGSDLAEAMYMARDAISLMGITLEDEMRTIPAPSCISAISAEPGDVVTLVDVDFAAYRKKLAELGLA